MSLAFASVEIPQAAEKFLILGLFTDGVDAGGDDPDGHAPLRAGDQQVDDHLVVGGLLSHKGEEANQQLGVQQIPLVVGEPQPLGQGPGVQRL